jgi:hypothetical protein
MRRFQNVAAAEDIANHLHTCQICGHTFSFKYCNACGEKGYKPEDKHLGQLLHESFHFLTHFEGSFFRTIGAVFTRLGNLSVKYTEEQLAARYDEQLLKEQRCSCFCSYPYSHCVLWTDLAIKGFYANKWVWSIPKAIIFAALFFGGIVFVYYFVLYFTVLLFI